MYIPFLSNLCSAYTLHTSGVWRSSKKFQQRIAHIYTHTSCIHYTHVHTHVHTVDMYIDIYLHICTYTYTYMKIHIHTVALVCRPFTYTYVHTHIHTWKYTYIHQHICTHTYSGTRMSASHYVELQRFRKPLTCTRIRFNNKSEKENLWAIHSLEGGGDRSDPGARTSPRLRIILLILLPFGFLSLRAAAPCPDSVLDSAE